MREWKELTNDVKGVLFDLCYAYVKEVTNPENIIKFKLEDVQTTIATDEITQTFLENLKNGKYNAEHKWDDIEFTADWLQKQLMRKEETVRKFEPSEKQIAMYSNLHKQFGLDVAKYDHFIEFYYHFNVLLDRNNKRPRLKPTDAATDKQKQAVAKAWLETFGEEKDVSNVTYGDVSNFFDEIKAKQKELKEQKENEKK